jgi:hypothetical protein
MARKVFLAEVMEGFRQPTTSSSHKKSVEELSSGGFYIQGTEKELMN